MEILQSSQEALAKATLILKHGGVVICPTDTVYGFVSDATNKKAVEKIYKIKKRPKGKPLPVFVSDLRMAKELAEIDAHQMKHLKKYWPGPYTFVLKRRMDVGRLSLFGQDKKTIALRVPKHSFLQKLLKKINRPLVQTSVNISGQKPLKSGEQIMATFGKSKLVDLIITSGKPLGPSTGSGQASPSKIVDLTTEKRVILRK